MGAVNLPVDWSIPDPLRKAPLAGGWKHREKKRLIMDMFYGNSIQDHKIKAQLQSTKYVFCVCFQGTLAETILQPLPFLPVLIAVAQL